MKFKFVCNWNTDYNIYKICDDIWNIDNKYELTYGDDYSHLIIFNDYDKNLIKVEKNNVFGFVIETKHSTFFNRNLPNFCNKVFYYEPQIFNDDNVIKTACVAPHHLFPKPYELHEVQYVENNTRTIINSNFEKTKTLSIIVSSISHYDRYNFVKKLLDSDLDFDMFGKDWNLNDSRYKGYITNKIDGIKNYKYTIALESYNISGWISEKFIDPILCRTIPIYNGHPDIFNYYPKSCEYLPYDGNEIVTLRNIINSNKTFDDYDFSNTQKLYLETYNPIELAKKFINNEE